MPHFLSEMRQAYDLTSPKRILSFYSGHVVISHIAVSPNSKIISNTLAKAKTWKIQFEIHTLAFVDLITPYVLCHM